MFLFYLFCAVLWDVVCKLGIPALLVSVVLTACVGGIVYASGGDVSKGMLYTAIGCVSFSTIAAVVATCAALSKPW
jgi:hypothetical protein